MAALTVWRLEQPVRSILFPARNHLPNTDFVVVLLPAAKEYARRGRLYHLELPHLLDPGGTGYKWPPTFVAVLQPFVDMPKWEAAAIFRWIYVSLYFLTLLLAATAWRVGFWRTTAMALVLVHWQPVWESLFWMQPEPLLLLLIMLSTVLVRGPAGVGGIPVGIAASLKVYPAVLGLYFVARRRWAAVVAFFMGIGLALGLTSLVVHPRHLMEYVTRILPYQGRVSLNPENLTAYGHVGRLALVLLGPEGQPPLPPIGMDELRTLNAVPAVSVRVVASTSYVALAAAMLLMTVQQWRRTAYDSSRRVSRVSRDSIGFSAAVCLCLILQTTAWPQYQTLLLAPLFAAIAAIPARDAETFGLLACSALPALLLREYGRVGAASPFLFSVLRGLCPVGLWLVHLRLLDGRGSAAEPTPVC